MKETDKELTRNHLQKSIFLLSTVPLQGYLMGRLDATTKAFFEQENMNDYELVESAYGNIYECLFERQLVQECDIYIGSSLRTLLEVFRERALVIFKAILLQKRVLVYSLDSSSTSNFIASVISLFPGQSFYSFNDPHINSIMSCLREYGLPLRLFNDKGCPLHMYFSISDLSLLAEECCTGYLIGTTNQLIRNHKKLAAEIIIDLDQNQITIANEQLKSELNLNSSEKSFIDSMLSFIPKNSTSTDSEQKWRQPEHIKHEKNFIGSSDWIRSQFSSFLISIFCDIAFLRNEFSKLEREITEKLRLKKQMKYSKRASQDILSPILPVKSKQRSEIPVDHVNKKVESNESTDETDHKIIKAVEPKVKLADSPVENETLPSNPFELILQQTSSDSTQVTQKMIPEELKRIEECISTSLTIHRKNSKNIIVQIEKIVSSLKRVNSKFLFAFLSSPAFKFWLENHDGNIRNRCNFSSEITSKIFMPIPNGTMYLGQMIRGKRSGKGQTFDFISKRMEVCENYIDDLKNGATSIQERSDSIYLFEGTFENDKKTGFGELKTKEFKYCGYFINDTFHGEGLLVCSDNSIYEGHFLYGQRCGEGKFTSGDGEFTYSGQFQNDKFHGQGILQRFLPRDATDTSPEDSSQLNFTYFGEFNNGLFEGQGTYTNGFGTIYQCEFKENVLVKNQLCVIKYTNGDVYNGFVENWLPHGEGLLIASDNTVQQGQFNQGIFIENNKQIQGGSNIELN